MTAIKRTLVATSLFAVSIQAIVAAINWNMTKDWPRYSIETSSTAHLGGRQIDSRA